MHSSPILSILKDIAKGYEFSLHASLEYVKNEEKFKEKMLQTFSRHGPV